MGSLILLEPGDDIECIIQDDLSILGSFQIYCKGSEVIF